jgi:CrcB protein
VTTPEPESVGARLTLVSVGAVAAGAVLGVLARYGLAQALPSSGAEIPWATLAANLSGSFAIGIVAGRLDISGNGSTLARPFLITGVLGSFTTYSTFAVETNRMLAGHPAVAVAYLLATLAGGLAAAWAGDRVGRR